MDVTDFHVLNFANYEPYEVTIQAGAKIGFLHKAKRVKSKKEKMEDIFHCKREPCTEASVLLL